MGLVGIIGDLCPTESARALTAVTLFSRDIEPGETCTVQNVRVENIAIKAGKVHS